LGNDFLKMLTKLMLDSEELARLNYERYYYPCPLVQKRLYSVYIKTNSNLSNKEVCHITGAHPNSLSKWIAIYKQEGFDGICQTDHYCNQRLLEKQALGIKKLFTSQK
jgi:hypothetical protein